MEPKSPDPMSRMPNMNIPEFMDLNAAAIAAATGSGGSSAGSSPVLNHANLNAKGMRHPKPSVPGMFNNLFDYGSGPGSANSTAPTSPEDGLMGKGMSDEFLKKAQAQLSGKASSSSSSAASAARGGGGGGKKGMDGFSTDWEGTVKAGKRGAGAGGGGWGKSLLSGVMSEDEMASATMPPGGFPSKPGGSISAMNTPPNGGGGGGAAAPTMSIWEAGKLKQQQQATAAKAAGGSASKAGPDAKGSGAGGETDDVFARFAKSQQLEAMKRTGGSR